MNMREHDDLPIKDGDCPMKLPECIPSGNQTCNWKPSRNDSFIQWENNVYIYTHINDGFHCHVWLPADRWL